MSLLTINNISAQEFPVLDWHYYTKGSGDLMRYRPYSVDLDKQDNIIVGAGIRDLVDLSIEDPSHFVGELTKESRILVKYSSSGNLLWAHLAEFFMLVIRTDSQNNIFLGGLFLGEVNFDLKGGQHLISAQQGIDAFLAKYSPDGDLIWAFSLPGNGYCAINDISIHEASNTVSIVGAFANQVEMNPDPNASHLLTNNQSARSTVLASYTLNGELKWANQVFADYDFEYQFIVHDDFGNLFWTSQFKDSIFPNNQDSSFYYVSDNLVSQGEDGIIAKYNEFGEYVWSVWMRGDRRIIPRGLAHNKGDIVFGGGSAGKYYFYVNNNHTFSNESSLGFHTLRPIILSLDAESGEINFVSELAHLDTLYGNSTFLTLSINDDGDYIVGGEYSAFEIPYLDLNPGIDTFAIEHTSSHEQAFFAKYSSVGDFKWGFTYPDGIKSSPLYVGTTSENNLLLFTIFMGEIDISAYGPTQTVSSFHSPSINDRLVIAMYKNSGLAINEDQLFSEILLFPNPSQNTNTLVFKNPASTKTRIDLY
ncbi:MAG: hypothetical protein JJT77_12840, partial [Crocinitomicaceae bacterium]|nr:hypothetical protein [Crocinitomicaceae bacterium]